MNAANDQSKGFVFMDLDGIKPDQVKRIIRAVSEALQMTRDWALEEAARLSNAYGECSDVAAEIAARIRALKTGGDDPVKCLDCGHGIGGTCGACHCATARVAAADRRMLLEIHKGWLKDKACICVRMFSPTPCPLARYLNPPDRAEGETDGSTERDEAGGEPGRVRDPASLHVPPAVAAHGAVVLGDPAHGQGLRSEDPRELPGGPGKGAGPHQARGVGDVGERRDRALDLGPRLVALQTANDDLFRTRQAVRNQAERFRLKLNELISYLPPVQRDLLAAWMKLQRQEYGA